MAKKIAAFQKPDRGDSESASIVDRLLNGECLRALALSADEHLLDVGCGFGELTCSMAGGTGRVLGIEAVPEKIELKVELYSQLDKLCKPETIFASNTSSLSITEMAAATERPQQFIGMHFFNPVHKMKLVEIVKGLETSEETIAATKAVGEKMGKETVTIKESPGFITSRINAMIGNEAFYMLQEGIATAEEIDKALKLGLNHPMGPFEMVDLVGLDTRLSILKFLHQTLGEKYRPCPLLEQYVRAGRLGRKTGKGVYDYTKK
ncbi:3-hydroxyacyl-CoA dehydrogenase [candidate division KSB1 bacterium]|nr:3-hydroxyacyl-CoA dehydrogenase [candidate division KSB1 bacterium]